MTSLASFSAPYVFGGSFRVMTTQIVASKLNGDLGLAMVETVALAVIGFAGLYLLRRTEGRSVVGTVRGVAPRRRDLAGGRFAVAAAGWGLAVLLLLPHASLVLLSFVPRNTWTTEALPPVLDLGNYRSLFSQPERLQPIANSLWMASAATALALVLGFAAAYVAVRAARAARARRSSGWSPRRGRCRERSSPSRSPRPSAPTSRGRRASSSSAPRRSSRSATSCGASR